MWGYHSINYWRHLNHNLHGMKHSIGTTHLTKMQIDMWWLRTCLAEAIPNCYEALWLGKKWNKQTPWCTNNSQQLLQLVSTYHCSAQGRWWKMPSDQLQGFEQGNMEICVAHAESWRYFSKAKRCQVPLNTLTPSCILSHTPRWRLYSQNNFYISFWKIWMSKISFGIGTSTSIFPRTDEWSTKGLTLCYCLLGWNYYIQHNCRRTTSGPFTTGSPQTLWCRTNYETEQVSLLCQGNSIFGPCPQHYWHQITPAKMAAIKLINPPKMLNK